MTLLTLLRNRPPPYYRTLLDTARRLAEARECESALVIAVMAAEIYTEQVFTALYEAPGIAYIAGEVDELLPSHSLGNAKVRTLYEALSGDPIATQRFWSAFKEATTRRNRAMHRGQRVDKQHALDAIQAVEAVAGNLAASLSKVQAASAKGS